MSDEKANLAATIVKALTDVGIVRHKPATLPCQVLLFNRTGLLIGMKTYMTDIFLSQ